MKLIQLMETLFYGALIVGLSADSHVHQNAMMMPSNTLVSDVLTPYFTNADGMTIPMPSWAEESWEEDWYEVEVEDEAQVIPPTEPVPEENESVLLSYEYGDPVLESAYYDRDFFGSTAIIGDSRGKGLMLFGNMAGVDLTAEALSVYNLWEKTFSTQYGTMTALQGLARGNFDRVYINTGINEVGYPSREKFVSLYTNLVDEIRRLQPNASIYVQGIIPVNETILHRNGTGTYINNTVIQEYNVLISELARDKQLHYVDLFSYFVDESGQLPSGASSDGLHFGAEYSKMWANYLYTHVVD